MRTEQTNRGSEVSDGTSWLYVLIATAILGFSAYDATSFTVSKLVIVAVSILVALLICRHQIDAPLPSLIFVPKTIFAFWGIMYIGTSGGILIGVAAAIATAGFRDSAREKLIPRVAADTIKIFVAAAGYYVAIQYLASPAAAASLYSIIVPAEALIAAVVMAAAYSAAGILLQYALWGLETSSDGSETRTSSLLTGLLANATALFSSIVFYAIFNHFGIELGLVIVPVALGASLAYKFHLRGLEQKTKQITEASRLHLATVEALATAIDARDQVGIGHVRRTQMYAVGMGKLLNLSEPEIDALRTGALLHDIGKLAVPDHILNKPGKLTPAEMEKTKIHSSVGASILENVGFPNPVVPTVKYHHECWDGSGYPDQLIGNAIPLTARVLAIADAYDTLRGARPYRPQVPRVEACSFLRARSGSHFDPQLVDLFMRNLNKFELEIAQAGLSYELEADQISHTNILHDDGGAVSYVEQIQRANREVFTLYSLAKDFSSALDLDETLSLFTRKIGEFVPFDTCLVYLTDAVGETATAVHAVGRHSEILKDKCVKLGEGATGYALKQRTAVTNIDPALDFDVPHDEIGNEYVAMASLPLIVDERLIGAISLYSNTMANYEEEHMRLIETVSRIAADAIAKSVHHAQAETFALTDPMTSLPNARSLQIHFEREIKRADRANKPFQLLMMDLDGFKAVNDTYGHKAGDEMLRELSRVIRSELREYDFLARYAGDEFVAIVPDTDSHGVLELCRRIETAVKNFELTVGTKTTTVGVSVGSACYPNHGETFDQVLIAADKAMYLTKAVHKHRFETPKPLDMASRPQAGPVPSALLHHGEESLGLNVTELDHFEDSLVIELDESQIIAGSAIN